MSWQNITLAFPPDSPMPLIGGKWRREANGELVAEFAPDELLVCMEMAMDRDKPVSLVGAELDLVEAFKGYDALYKNGATPQQRIKAGEELVRREPDNVKASQALVWLRGAEAAAWAALSRALDVYERVCEQVGGYCQWPYEPATAEYLGVNHEGSAEKFERVAGAYRESRMSGLRDRFGEGDGCAVLADAPGVVSPGSDG